MSASTMRLTSCSKLVFFVGSQPSSLLGFGRVAPEVDHVRRTVEIGRHLDHDFSGLAVDSFLVLTFSLEDEVDSGTFEGQ